MCLITNDLIKYKANKNITCYKIVKLRSNKVISYYYNFKYTLNKLYESEIVTADSFTVDSIYVTTAFHSYKSLRYVLNTLHTGLWNESNDVVAICIIPKGANYYQNKDTFASDQLIIKQIL